MKRKFRSKPFYYRVTGSYALFTAPETRGGGEKMTYPVPTYSALKGISEAIYWKPSLKIIVSEVKVINPITTESIGTRTLTDSKKALTNDISYYTYLRDVEYLVKFYFEWNTNRPELKDDWKEIKHQEILLRSLDRGGRRDIFLGTRECVGQVERLTVSDYQEARSHYEGNQMSLGIMFHSFTYPDEAYSEETKNKLTANYTGLHMIDGVIRFPLPEECQLRQPVRDYNFKTFDHTNTQSVDDEWQEMVSQGGD